MEEKVFDDRVYLDGIFAIYQPILETKGKIDRSESKQKEESFWETVKKEKEAGKDFLVEKLAAHYGLDPFEKRVLLLFLCLEFTSCGCKSLWIYEALDILDFNCTFTGRIKNSAYFRPDGALVVKGILDICADRFHENEENFRINSSTVDMILRALDGSEVKWKDVNTAKKKPNNKVGSKAEAFGLVKRPSYDIANVVVNDQMREELFLFLEAFKGNALERLGAFQTVKKGRGLTLLFYGPPGTGKSMLAEAVAAYVKKKILVVDASKVRAKFYGDTEKRIAAIFKSATEEDLVILMDEADTFLYDRSFAREEHDIMFVNVMLNELERFEGIIIMTTNMDCLLDGAAERRIALKVKFELPDMLMREHIWKTHIPDKIKVAEGVDFAALAERYEFSGGNIKNAFLNSVRRLAQKSNSVVTMEDLIFGAELEKKGMFSAKNKQKTIKGFASN